MNSTPPTTVKVREVDVESGTLIARAFVDPDYTDAFLIDPTSNLWKTIEEFATDFFERQPRWIAMISMNLTSRKKLHDELGDRRYPQGHLVGSWKVYDRSADEIVFGDNMGFMEYRFSMRRLHDGRIIGSTAVQYRWKRVSRFYFGLVKPFHRLFIPIALRHAAKQVSTWQDVVGAAS